MTRTRISLAIVLLVLLSYSYLSVASTIVFPWPVWSELSPVVVDTVGDEEVNYDILECYIASDDDFFYFRIQVVGDIVKSSIYVLLDTDQNAATGDDGTTPASVDYGGELSQHGLGADYYLDPVDTADLWVWVGYWQWVTPVAWRLDPGSLEIAVTRAELGNPDHINVLFIVNPPDTDYAPNRGYVTYPLAAVGGTILPPPSLLGIVLCLSVGVMAVAGAIGLRQRRRPGRNQRL